MSITRHPYSIEDHMYSIRSLVSRQAEEEALWVHAETAPEACLQHALRRLHALIDATPLNFGE